MINPYAPILESMRGFAPTLLDLMELKFSLYEKGERLGMEKERLGMEKERLGMEKERVARELTLHDLQIKELQKKFEKDIALEKAMKSVPATTKKLVETYVDADNVLVSEVETPVTLDEYVRNVANAVVPVLISYGDVKSAVDYVTSVAQYDYYSAAKSESESEAIESIARAYYYMQPDAPKTLDEAVLSGYITTEQYRKLMQIKKDKEDKEEIPFVQKQGLENLFKEVAKVDEWIMEVALSGKAKVGDKTVKDIDTLLDMRNEKMKQIEMVSGGTPYTKAPLLSGYQSLSDAINELRSGKKEVKLLGQKYKQGDISKLEKALIDVGKALGVFDEDIKKKAAEELKRRGVLKK